MTTYCEICGEELNPGEEDEGICESYKASRRHDYDDEEDDHDPGIT